jgi:hypothetical protein
MARDNFAPINISNAKLIFRTNFKGIAGPWNNEGERNFNVILEDEALEQALAYGMNVKMTNPRGDYEPVNYIKVNIGYKFRAPHVELINSRVKRVLNENTIGILDDFEYDNIDIVLRPNRWHRPNGDTGVNAYLQSMYATIAEDAFANKYYDIPTVDDDGAIVDY